MIVFFYVIINLGDMMKYSIKVNNTRLQEAINHKDKKIVNILNFFNIENVDIKITVLKYEDFKKEYESYLERELNGYSVGFIEDNKNEVIIIDYDDYKYTSHNGEPYEYYVKVAIHEFVHAVHAIACNHNYPETKVWEGIAVYLSEQYDFNNHIGYGSYYEYGLYMHDYINCHTKEDVFRVLNIQ